MKTDFGGTGGAPEYTPCQIAASFHPISLANPARRVKMIDSCCGSCCTSMATVNPSPAVCQTVCCSSGDGGSLGTQGFLNTIGKFGLTLAGQLQGRPVTVTNRGVSVGPSAQYMAQRQQALTPVLIIILIAVFAFLLLSKK